ncbi:MAG: helix-turn-helix transcriptional regulator [Spirochaetia bacterium]|nr:helix-turn-helix transcriptional regulator [Spirochaetia bacterium]
MTTKYEMARILGENIRAHRNRLGMTQADFAAKIQRSKTYLAELESGKKYASMEIIALLATAFNLRPYELFLDDDPNPDQTREAFRDYAKDIPFVVYDAVQKALDKYAKKHSKR